jgi:hypothetical protein
MKSQAEKNRQELTLEVGDWVYVKLQPYVQQSVSRCSNNKLSFKYFGPYLILQKVGQIAYKLQLPVNSQIHNCIHVSQLKKAIHPNTPLSADEDLQLLPMLETLPPSQVLSTRLHLIGHHVVPLVLVQRVACPVHWAIWEKQSVVSKLLPVAPPDSAPSSSASRGRAAS